MSLSHGFAPIARADAKVLILGSLPGQKSLQEQEYYAHPRNAFWQIMAETFAATGEYDRRCEVLIDSGVAVWDVLRASVRPGSLDSDIRNDTAQVNDFEEFVKQHPELRLVLFNGKKAQQLFTRFVADGVTSHLQLAVVPSTSPAFAAMPYAEKLKQWQAAMQLVFVAS